MNQPDDQVRPANTAAPAFTFPGIVLGFRIGLPLMISSFLTGMVMGVTYHKLGIELVHAIALSAVVFSGTAQAVTATMMMVSPLPVAAMALALIGVNARYLVMSAQLRTLFPDVKPKRMLPALFLLVDAGWLITVSRAEKGQRDAGLLLGSGLAMYLGWVAGTSAGHMLGLAPSGPLATGIAFLPLGFIVAIVPSQWKGSRTLPSWLLTAVAALAAFTLVPAAWAALIGAACGTILAALRDNDDK